MSRTIKHRLARTLHKQIRAAHWSCWREITRALPAGAKSTRYGNNRKYKAVTKLKSRKSARNKAK